MKIKLSLVLLCLLLFASCSQGGSFFGREKTPSLNEFRKGIQGIEIEFLPKFPPETAVAGDNIPIIIKAKNMGATDVEYGRVVLHSTTGNVLVTPSNKEFSLFGKDAFRPQGEELTLEFEAKIREVGSGKTTLIAYSCYGYESKYVNNLCIDPTLGKVSVTDKSCEMKDLKATDGQGGPVAVKSVSVLPLLNNDELRLRLNITIQNEQQGKIVSSDLDSQDCFIAASHLSVGDVLQVDVELSDARVQCDRKILGFEKESNTGTVLCTTGPIVRESASNSPLVVTLRYGYVSREISKQISIIS